MRLALFQLLLPRPAASPSGLTPLALWLVVVVAGVGIAWHAGRRLRALGEGGGGRATGWGGPDWLAPAATGLVIGLVILTSPHEMMETRMDGLRATLAGWSATHRPLVYATRDGLLRGTFGDDPGLYLLAPAFHGLGLGPTSARTFMAAVVTLGLLAVLLVVWWALRTRRQPARWFATLAPAFVLAAFVLWEGGDVYAMPGLVALLGVALLFADALGRLASTRALALATAGFVVVAITATLCRGTTLAVAAAVAATSLLVFARERPARRLVRVAALAAVLVGPRLVVGGITRYRDAAFARADAAPLLDRHMLWHSLYIGLGVVPNRYGIIYRDSSAENYVRRVDPRAVYQSPEYEAVLRARFAQLARDDAPFVLRQFLLKAGVLGLSFLLLLPFFPERRRVWGDPLARRFLLAGVAIALAGLLPGLLVVPVLRYSAAGVLVLLFLGPFALLVARRHPEPAP